MSEVYFHPREKDGGVKLPAARPRPMAPAAQLDAVREMIRLGLAKADPGALEKLEAARGDARRPAEDRPG